MKYNNCPVRRLNTWEMLLFIQQFLNRPDIMKEMLYFVQDFSMTIKSSLFSDRICPVTSTHYESEVFLPLIFFDSIRTCRRGVSIAMQWLLRHPSFLEYAILKLVVRTLRERTVVLNAVLFKQDQGFPGRAPARSWSSQQPAAPTCMPLAHSSPAYSSSRRSVSADLGDRWPSGISNTVLAPLWPSCFRRTAARA